MGGTPAHVLQDHARARRRRGVDVHAATRLFATMLLATGCAAADGPGDSGKLPITGAAGTSGHTGSSGAGAGAAA